jgi:hypothetical protein
MITMRRGGASMVVCALMSLWLVAPASGSVASASGPPTPVGSTPTGGTTYKQVASEFSLTVSPTRLVVGQKDIGKVQKVLVVNQGQSPVSVTVQKRSFTGGRDGALVFQENAPYSASNWVTVSPTSFTVAPGVSQTVTATIKVPAGPEPGDHQVALVFMVPAGKSAGNIKINRGIGAPVYITVPGPVDDSASLSDLSAKGFAMRGPVTLTATMNNTGTVHRDFRGATPLKVTGAGTAAPFPDFTVIRGSTRDISTTWNPPLICICNPTVSFVNAAGTVQSYSVRVIVLPLPLMGIFLATLLLGWLVVALARRRYQASVLKAAALLSRPVVGEGVA